MKWEKDDLSEKFRVMILKMIKELRSRIAASEVKFPINN